MVDVLVTATGLEKAFGGGSWLSRRKPVRALREVSFDVRRDETLGIVGESGSGKSTLLRTLLRLIRPDAGTIRMEGSDIWQLRGRQLQALRRRVQPVFQNPASSFNPRQTIRSILRAPLEVHGIGTGPERDARIIELLERVGLEGSYLDRLPHQLSGGQKQRIAIARAVILRPTLLLADEPTSALDVSVQAQVLRLFLEVKREFGLTTVFVSHNLAVIRQVSDRVLVMRHGEIVERGTVAEIFDNPQHEYTRQLIAAVPDTAAARRRLAERGIKR
jgi:ABC-type glutathione transport system ATPase component